MDRNIRICYTSDLHGYFFPTTYASRNEGDMGLFKCVSHFKKDNNTIVIDGGDILQGSAFVNYCQSEYGSSLPISEIMNRCGYDFVTLGNHDFNYGLDYLSSYVNALDAKCVCQNLCKDSGEVPYPFQIRTMGNGIKVGVVGIVTDHVTVWERPENLKGIRITDPFEAAKSALEIIRGKCDVSVCVYHGGFERDLDTGTLLTTSTANAAWRICEELDFDILLTGHQHMSISGRYINGTYAVQPAENGKECHIIDVRVGMDGSKLIDSQRVTATGECEQALCKEYQNLDDHVQIWLDKTVGCMEIPLFPENRIDMAAHGSGIADFLNYIQLLYSGAEVSAVSLANYVSGFNETVTRRDILSTCPYPNSLIVVELTGALLREAIERSAEYFTLDGDVLCVSKKFLKPKVEHYNYDYFAGVDYTIDVTRPFGKRIISLERGGIALEDSDTISVCVTNYRYSGAGDYPMYQNGKVLREINTDMTDLMLNFFENTSNVSRADMERHKNTYKVLKGNVVL